MLEFLCSCSNRGVVEQNWLCELRFLDVRKSSGLVKFCCEV